jgi:hypothetical protein
MARIVCFSLLQADRVGDGYRRGNHLPAEPGGPGLWHAMAARRRSRRKMQSSGVSSPMRRQPENRTGMRSYGVPEQLVEA